MIGESEDTPITQEKSSRNQELDFLRGCAILLVLRMHHPLEYHTENIGWIGVDLFFVLSGFLVSGLLFAEYKEFGFVKPFYFLVRRGFKIYPLFYLSLIVSAVIYIQSIPPLLNYKGVIVYYLITFLPEVFFLQNYLSFVWGHHWSLAVEEHFYILLSILIYLFTKFRLLNNRAVLLTTAFVFFGGCLLFRFVQNLVYPGVGNTFIQTHLRIDSLFMGVVIAYFYHFYPAAITAFYHRYKRLLQILFFIPFLLLPITFPTISLRVKTIGFSMIYVSFGSLLLIFLFSQTVKKTLPAILSPFVYRMICSLGVYSYSIYLFHMYIIRYLINPEFIYNPPPLNAPLAFSFIGYFLGSIFLGIAISHLVERPFLKVRDKYFPKRT